MHPSKPPTLVEETPEALERALRDARRRGDESLMRSLYRAHHDLALAMCERALADAHWEPVRDMVIWLNHEAVNHGSRHGMMLSTTHPTRSGLGFGGYRMWAPDPLLARLAANCARLLAAAEPWTHSPSAGGAAEVLGEWHRAVRLSHWERWPHWLVEQHGWAWLPDDLPSVHRQGDGIRYARTDTVLWLAGGVDLGTQCPPLPFVPAAL